MELELYHAKSRRQIGQNISHKQEVKLGGSGMHLGGTADPCEFEARLVYRESSF